MQYQSCPSTEEKVLEPHRAYQIYCETKLKIRDGVRSRRKSISAFEGRNDMAYFRRAHKVAQTEDRWECYCISAFLQTPDAWIGDMVDTPDRFEKSYLNRRKFLSAPLYRFTEDIKKLLLKKAMREHAQAPSALCHLLMTHQVHRETVMVLDQLLGFVDVSLKFTSDNAFWVKVAQGIQNAIDLTPITDMELDAMKSALQREIAFAAP